MKISLIKYTFFGLALAASVTSCTSEGDKFEYGKSAVFFTGTEIDPLIKFSVEDTPAAQTVSVMSTHPVSSDVTIHLAIDNSKLEEYNEANRTAFVAAPQGSVELVDDKLVIPAGKAFSNSTSMRVLSTEDFKEGESYVVPVTMTTVDGSDVLESSRTVFYRISASLQFTALDISNPDSYSNFIFDDSQAVEMSNYTVEIKFWATDLGQRPGDIRRMISWTSKDESRTIGMLRFSENGQPAKSLQWCGLNGNVMFGSTFTEERWYTISLVCDGTKRLMYVDGQLDAEATGDGNPVTFQRLEIGMSWENYRNSQRFPGRIAEIRVWDYARSAGEIANSICNVNPASEGLRAYWKMNEGEGHIFHDASGNNMDIDWSKAVRDAAGNGQLVATPESKDAIRWVDDEFNKCAQ